ncbi:hypothetical protein [Spiroplasma endosymbiont of Aspidapion aeneum]|uniref:hypothetical protein n=1 Tax=Spiroplasma endosymbiont of Aspidapion aeneum TaxID=3066276 RepID=UPI00313ECCCE
MKNKHYDKNIKKNVVERFKNGESAKMLADELNIYSGPQLVYIWAKKEKFCYPKDKVNCKENKIMAKKLKDVVDQERLKLQNKEIKELKKENERLKKTSRQSMTR